MHMHMSEVNTLSVWACNVTGCLSTMPVFTTVTVFTILYNLGLCSLFSWRYTGLQGFEGEGWTKGGLYCPPHIPAGFLRISAQSQDSVLADVPANFCSPVGVHSWGLEWVLRISRQDYGRKCDESHDISTCSVISCDTMWSHAHLCWSYLHTWHITNLFPPTHERW